MSRLVLSCALLVACSGANKTPAFPPVPAEKTEAPLTGARCPDNTVCKCRDPGVDDVETAPVATGHKRYEFRVATGPGQAWVTVDGRDLLFKSSERAEECFYLDLEDGAMHQVSLRTHATKETEGFGVNLRVAEYGAKGPWWYDTFAFQCGMPGACAKDSLRTWKQETDALPKNLRDPCGSTKLKGISWQTGRVPDSQHPEEILLAFTLHVYPFEPNFAPGDAGCAKGGED